MANLTISFTPPSPAPALGYRVKYWNTTTPATVITVSPNPTASPVVISGVATGCYAGTVESICSAGVYSSTAAFSACSPSGSAYCVEVTSENFNQASTECPGVTDTYTVYTFTLKQGGTTVTAPSNVTITFDGYTNFPGGGVVYNGTATILTGNSTATATVWTYQALDGAPGCGCPCPTTVSINTESFAATIASPNTVSICLPAPTTAGFTINNISSYPVSLTGFDPAWFTIESGIPSSLSIGGSATGTHGGYIGNFGVTVGSSNGGCLILAKNEGTIIQSIPFSGAGIYTFTSLNILSTDEVVLQIANSCP